MRARGTVRIIAGRWRRRLLPVPDAPGLRPTPDRVRETLFNWIAADLPGARCLDLFAGTGALGFEAASRGASRVLLVERETAIAEHLRRQAAALDAQAVEVLCADARYWSPGAGERFDMVFVDPPYGAVDLPVLLAGLAAGGALAEHARVYVEAPADSAPSAILPAAWSVLREQRAGRVRYHLASPAASDPA